jgi:hypothetical protein
MKRTNRSGSARWTLLLVAVATLVLLPGWARAADEGSVAATIKAMIMADNEYTRANMKDKEGGVSKHGSVEFWSSGGLVQWTAPDAGISEYDEFSLTPKHIEVIELPGGQAAVAMYYSEGSMKRKGAPGVSNYLTRVTDVFVLEDGKWVSRAAHYSAIIGGTGTNQTSVD